ncbi:RlpA-like double-psi beta-barrel-protein domain-containing protein-containing protein [Pyronema domesticum]|uniref:Similar to Allergen Asp f 7 acc. no. O42799 n=1 Tax=Pyronema omphalodes (strain CBS 100304) TaxID=1076935 RepID=U4LVX3_PYROM|nr:RlpA-like double-psi beta-barrel-protein domain-containing protein-containing protein [Pyronema domesticum]CCX34952.1 Similar to Allergen Asp f 7; acc. no. O42799 [Pyronema omphalodes CBS 100304]
MKVQALFVIASALVGALAAPIEKREPRTVTVYETVVHVVTSTHTSWVAPTALVQKPEEKQPAQEQKPKEEPAVPSPAPAPAPVIPSPVALPKPVEKPVQVPTPAPTSVVSVVPELPIKAPEPEPKPEPSPEPKPEPIPQPSPEPVAPKPEPVTPAPAPEPVTPAPAPSPEPVTPAPAPVAPSPAPAPAPPSGGSDVTTGSTPNGLATYYTPGSGSCGGHNSISDDIVAISHKIMEPLDGGNPNSNPICGRQIKVSYKGKSLIATVVDKCMGCAPEKIDLSQGAFEKLSPIDPGVIKVSWEWL